MRIIFVVSIGSITVGDQLSTFFPNNWKVIESLAEEYPYIVALLNANQQYVCTGITINKRTILTSGHCVDPPPHYIAVATAVIIGGEGAMRNLVEVAATVLHNEYTFDVKQTEPNITRVHSNIALVLAVRPALVHFVSPAEIANHYATELRDTRMTVVGYGELYTGTIVLQRQVYNQTPCSNPKWYYCVCGLEDSIDILGTYEKEFGEGAPVLLDKKVVAIAATPSGSMIEPKSDVKYNIFTVIGPYLSWIDKSQTLTNLKLHALINSSNTHKDVLIKYILILLVITFLINVSSV